jgi:hypothetical protein
MYMRLLMETVLDSFHINSNIDSDEYGKALKEQVVSSRQFREGYTNLQDMVNLSGWLVVYLMVVLIILSV